MNLPIREQTDSRAATRLSTAPEESRPGRVPRGAGGLAILLRGWRRLTSMRTALVLLLVLAMAALPGSLLPQQRLNPFKVAAFLRQHPTLGPIYQRLGFFDVFAAPWFAAVYLLLFVSLIGCLIPRLRLHLRALLRRPPAAPSRLDRLPHQRGFDAATPTTQLHAAALALLRRKHWRIRRGTEPAGVLTISAEKGYLRETGNLIFHLALVLLLLGMAIGKLYGYSGTVVVQANAGFCNTVSQFDSFSAGPWVNQARLTPLCVTLKKFSADYTSAGIASQFRADIAYTTNRDGTDATPYRLEVNHPLRRGGNRLYLLGHGFSPQFTIRDPAGDVFDRVSAPFLPQDGNLTSSGVLKLPDARPQQLAIEGVFAPSAIFDPAGRLVSASPVPNRPAIAIFVDRGDLGLDAGQPQSVYSIDPAQFSRGLLRRVAARTLRPGESMTLADGTRITFSGYTQWANLQVSHDPAQSLVLLAAVLIVAGLLSSLRVRRRRLWLRITPTGAGGCTVQVGGLSRSDPAGNEREFTALTERIRAVDGVMGGSEPPTSSALTRS